MTRGKRYPFCWKMLGSNRYKSSRIMEGMTGWCRAYGVPAALDEIRQGAIGCPWISRVIVLESRSIYRKEGMGDYV